ncbi:MAG: hypothetical protein JWQ29_3339 [Phenylobacterium sp.]|nr:hypothetical protein [Phenylobacterium sp.]
MAEVKKGVYPPPIKDPYADASSQPFWDAALEGRLVGAKCSKCGTVQLQKPPYCYVCQSPEFSWETLPGTGTIYTFTVVRHPLRPQLAEVVPYVGAIIDLDGTQGAGARVMANVIDCDPDKVRIGDRVQVVFETVSDTFAVPRFRPL